MAKKPIRPIIVVEAVPTAVDHGQGIALSARMFDKETLQPVKVSRIFMTITSMQDGHVVWPLEVVRKDADGFDIMVGTEDMKPDHDYLIRVSNNWNLSPSASTTIELRKKKSQIPIILPIIPFIPDLLKGPFDEVINPLDSYREVDHFVFRTQMDHRVCPECQQWQDQIFRPSDNFIPRIPVHPNCRCTMDIIYKRVMEVTASMQHAARLAVLIDDLEAPLDSIPVINQHYY